MDQPPVSTRWLILQQRIDGDVDTYMDSVQANVLGQVRSSDPSGSTWSSKLVDTYPTMSEFVHHHLASWACWSEKLIRLVMLMAVPSRKFIHTNIHHQVPGRWFVKLVKAKDTFQRMLKKPKPRLTTWVHGGSHHTPTDAPRIRRGDGCRKEGKLNQTLTDKREMIGTRTVSFSTK